MPYTRFDNNSEREPAKRHKDAADIAYLLQYYNLEDRDNGTFWSDEWSSVMEENGYDHSLVAMQLLGRRAAQIATTETHAYVSRLLDDALERRSLETLAFEMSRSARNRTEECLRWLTLFQRGFTYE